MIKHSMQKHSFFHWAVFKIWAESVKSNLIERFGGGHLEMPTSKLSMFKIRRGECYTIQLLQVLKQKNNCLALH